MRVVRAENRRGPLLGDRIAVADRWWPRFRGLLGRRGLEAGEGLLLEPCRAGHMLGMRVSLVVAFLDQDGAVIAAYADLKRGARSGWHRQATRALQLPVPILAAKSTREG